jgi:RecA-family ATPase
MALGFVNGHQYIELPNEENWIAEPILPSGGLVNFYGKPKSGKTIAALGLAQAISVGAGEWNGFRLHRGGRVAYLQIDTPRGETQARVKRLIDHGYDLKNLFIADMNIAPYPYNVLLPQHQAWLRLQLEQLQPVLVVIDTIREAHDGDENDSTDMKRVINILVSIARPAAILLISHSRKDNAMSSMGDGDLMDDARGSSYMSGRMDTIVKFSAGKEKTHMTYKGRSVEQTKLTLMLDKGPLLLRVDGEQARLEQLVHSVMREMPTASRNAMAKEIEKRANGSMSARTATRWIEKLSGLVEP